MSFKLALAALLPAIPSTKDVVSRSVRIPTLIFSLSIPFAIAGPEGENIVGGSGSVKRDGNTTTINQNSDRMAIDWRSYDVDANERVQYIQPDSTSISLNRILSNRGSQILGQIDANGHVILMNPNGIIFGEGATVNAGGLLATGLSIDPSDFLNGNFTFSAIEGTDGSVINRGLLNASVGGSISLLGKRVENSGLISADLGAVNLAAGKGAVVTFDDEGLMGLRVTEAVLQEDLGVDPAIVNSGEISAENGQILISASVSEDIFSDAVNHGELNRSSSVLVHDDGSFTLGEGADVVNTGSIDVSGSEDAGDIVVIGENVTNSGDIRADISEGNENSTAGAIEMHSNDITLLDEQSSTSAVAHNAGSGGDIKILGDKVGLMDEAVVDASGYNSGGQVLFGGDETGANPMVRNANFIFLGEQTDIFADALSYGNGGRVISFAQESAQIYGGLFARGGYLGGDGGFIETSGLLGFDIRSVPDVGSPLGEGGMWLIDPVDMEIHAGSGFWQLRPDLFAPGTEVAPYWCDGCYGSSFYIRIVYEDTLNTALSNGDVRLSTINISPDPDSDPLDEGGDIIFLNDIIINQGGGNTLILDARGDIVFQGVVRSTVMGGTDFDLNANGNLIFNSTGSLNSGGGWVDIDVDGYVDMAAGSFITAMGAQGWVDINALSEVPGSNVLSRISANDLTLTVASAGVSQGESAGMFIPGDLTINAAADSVINFANYGNELNGSLSVIGATGVFMRFGDSNVELSNINTNGDFTLITDFGFYDSTSAFYIGGDLNLISDFGGNINLGSVSHTIDGRVNIFSENYFASGNITLAANEINVGTIISRNSDPDVAGGDITLTAQNNIIATSSSSITSSVGIDGSAGDIRLVGSAAENRFTGGINWTGASFQIDGLGGSDTVDFSEASSVDVDLQHATDVSIENYIGNNSVSVIRGPSGENTWTITGVNDGTVIDGAGNLTNFTDFDVIFAQSGNDTFIFEANGEITNYLRGFGGGDTIVGRNADAFWDVTGGDTGQLRDDQGSAIVRFDGIQNLTGGTGSDTFIVDSEGAISGAIDGGAGTDTILGRNAANTWAIFANEEGSVAATSTGSDYINSFIEIENLSGGTNEDHFVFADGSTFLGYIDGGDGNDTLTGRNVATTWSISANEEGSLAATSTGLDYINSFVEIENLSGGTNDDRFVFADGVTFLGAIEGGGASTGDTADFTNQTNAHTVDLNTTTFSSVETFVGNGANMTLVGLNGQTNEWVIFGENDGTLNGINILDFVNITGGDAADDFSIAATGNITGQVNGGAGSDTISGRDAGAYWDITANDQGQLRETEASPDYIVDFVAIENLTGQTGADTFVMSAAGGISGTIDGGTGPEQDFLDGSSSPLIVNLNSGINGATNIELIRGNGSGSILTGADTANTWNITGINSGDIAGGIQFEGFDAIVGGSGADVFVFADSAAVDSIDGGGINLDDEIDISAYTSDVLADLAAGDLAGMAFTGIETLTANASQNNTLVGLNQDNVWTITAANSGDVEGLAFIGFHHLEGGTGIDDFVLAGGSVSGSITGGDASDSLTGNNSETTWDITAVNAGSMTDVAVFTGIENLIGGTADDSFVVSGTGQIASIDGGAAPGNDTLTGNNQSNTWNITGINAGSVTDVTGFSNIENLVGGNTTDVFILEDTASVVSIDGGGINLDDEIDISAYTSDVLADLAAGDLAGMAFTGIETLTANASQNNTLVGLDQDSVWTITAANAGDVEGLAFIDFHHLEGGTGIDDFVLAGGGVSGSITGGDASDSLTGNNSTTAWDITAANAGSMTDVAVFTGIENLIGGTGDDNFVVSGTGQIASIDGGAAPGNDTLTGNNQSNTWNITGMNAGSVTDVTGFSDIENLIGGTDADVFILADTASVVSIDGGGINLDDEIDISAYTSDVLADLAAGDLAGMAFTGIETLTANASQNNTLVGLNQDNVWTITTANSGDVEGLAFIGFHNLEGGTGLDSFVLSGGSITGIIDGGNPGSNSLTGNDALNNWQITDLDTGTVEGVGQFENIGTLIGGNATDNFVLVGGDLSVGIVAGEGVDSLRANTGTNTWNIYSDNNGSVQGINFTSIENLIGGSGIDTFIFGDGVSVATIDGGSETDTVDLTAYTSSVSFDLENEIVAGMDVTSIEIVDTDDSQGNTLIGLNQVNDWQITGINSGTLNAFGFSGFSSLIGGDTTDTFLIAGGSLSGSIDGGGGIDTLTADNVDNDWELTGINSGQVTGIDSFSQIENLVGGNTTDSFIINGGSVTGYIAGGDGSDTLQAGNAANNWNITANYLGDVTGVAAFSGIENLVGGTASDVFVFADSAAVDSIDGGGVNLDDEIDISAYSSDVLADLAAGDLAGMAFTGIETLTANASQSNTLVGLNQDNVWTITAANSGDVEGLAFIGFHHLEGGTGIDDFVLAGGSVSGSITGGDASDSLTGNNSETTWDITAVNAGSMTDVAVFAGIENLIGGTADDSFVVSGTGQIASIDGGAAPGNDTLTGNNQSNTWNITGINAGSVTDVTGFSNIENLVGGNTTDVFILEDTASVVSIDGGGINLDDQIDISAYTSDVLADLAAGDLAGMAFTGIETLTANASQNNTLVGLDQDSVWTITAANAGDVEGLAFIDFHHLEGGTGIDDFVLAGGGVSGSITGGDASDSLTGNNSTTAWDITAANAGSMTDVAVFTGIENLIGGTGDDNFVVSGTGQIASIDGGAAPGNDTLTGNNQSNTWNITGINAGSVTDVTGFSDIENLIGGDDADAFILADNASVVSIDGGDNLVVDEIDISAYSSDVLADLDAGALGVTASGTAITIGFSNIETLTANTSASVTNTLVGENQANDWAIIAGNSGTVSTATSSTTFNGFEILVGGNDLDRFGLFDGGSVSEIIGSGTGAGDSLTRVSASDAATGWAIDGLNAGTVTDLSSGSAVLADFAGIEHLIGSSGDDSFVLSGVGQIVSINGGLGSNSLTANGQVNTWNIVGTNQGDVTDVGGFTDIETLMGGNARDLFIIADNASVVSIDGGDNLVVDEIDISAYSSDVLADLEAGALDTTASGSAITIDFTNVETLTANAAPIVSNTLVGENQVNDWAITAGNSGTVSTATSTATFNGFETLVGGNDLDSFVLFDGGAVSDIIGSGAGAGDSLTRVSASDAATGWALDGLNTGTVTDLSSGSAVLADFAGIENLIGSSGDDSFVLSGAGQIVSINGGLGSNSLTANNQINTWNIVGTNQGDVTGVGGFTDIETLIGGDNTDIFIFSDGAAVSRIEGGPNAVIDTVDLTAYTSSVSVDLENSMINSMEISSIEVVITDAAQGNTLYGLDLQNTWLITGVNSGSLNDFGFSGFTNLVGGSGEDVFELSLNGSVTGSIDGGTGVQNSLSGNDTDNTWNITGANSGSMNDVVAFSNIENLMGGSGVDDFTLELSGSITGRISGGGEVDSLTIESAASQAVSWTIDVFSEGTVNGVSGGFDAMENLYGRAGDDTFTIEGDGTVNVNIAAGEGSDVFNINAVTNGLLQGQDGSDSFNISEDVSVTIDGGAGDDTFTLINSGLNISIDGGLDTDTVDVAHTDNNTWTLNGINDRVEDQSTGAAFFDSIEVANGGDAIDIYFVTSDFTGDINGEANNDIFNLSASVTGAVLGGAGADEFNILVEGFSGLIRGGDDQGDIDSLHVNHGGNNATWIIDDVSTVTDDSGIAFTFDGMELLQGDDQVDTFYVETNFNGRILAGRNNDNFHLSANVDDSVVSTTDVIGGEGDDSFYLYAVDLLAMIDGGTHTVADRVLLEHNVESYWIIDGVNNRVVDDPNNGFGVRFSGVEEGLGGSATDRFELGADFQGRFFGRGGEDVFRIAANINDGNSNTSDLVGGAGNDIFEVRVSGLTNVSIDGGLFDQDIISIAHLDSTDWLINGAENFINGLNTFSFTDIEQVVGGNGADTFNVQGVFSGTLNGQGGDDVFNLSANVNTLVLGGTGNDIFNIEETGLSLNLDGEGGMDTVSIGHQSGTTWTFDDDAYRVEEDPAVENVRVQFVDVEITQGGDDVDTFIVNTEFDGRIEGGGDDDNFILSANVTNGVFGGLGDDVFNLSASVTQAFGNEGNDQFNILALNLTLDLDAGDGLLDTITGPDSDNDWLIGPTNTLNGSIVFDGLEIFIGGSGADNFTVADGARVEEIRGAEGANSLAITHTRDNTNPLAWRILDENAGTVRLQGTIETEFFDIENITGGEGQDNFRFVVNSADANPDITGLIDGNTNRNPDGGVFTDTLILEEMVDGISVELGDSESDSLHVINMERIVGASGSPNRLENIRTSDFYWEIDGLNQGTIYPGSRAERDSTPLETRTEFENFSTIIAGDGDNTFNFIGSGWITGALIGGVGNNNVADFSQYLDDLFILVTDGDESSPGISGFSFIIGNNDGIDSSELNDATISVASGVNTWDIENTIDPETDGINDGQFSGAGAANFTFVDFNNIEGGAGDDQFNLMGDATITGTLGGGIGANGSEDTFDATGAADDRRLDVQIGGDDDRYINLVEIETVRANSDSAVNNFLHASDEGSNDWIIDGVDQGRLDTVIFSGFANLVGTTGVDTFTLTDLGRMSGLIDAGGGALDSVNLNALTSDISVVLRAEGNSPIDAPNDVLYIVGAETIASNDANINQFFADDINNTWNIDGDNSGEISRTNNVSTETTVRFSNFSQLYGGAQNDDFVFSAGAQVSGHIDGGESPGADSLNIQGLQSPTSVGIGLTAISNLNVVDIESIDANANVANTLIADDAINTWTITGDDAGRLNDRIDFSGFANLEGRDQRDTFTFNANGSISGYIFGAGQGQGESERDSVDMSALDIVDVSVGDGADLRNIERVIGNGANSSLPVDSTLTTEVTNETNWRVSSENAGFIDILDANGVIIETIEFIGFNNIGGSIDSNFDSVDRFLLRDGGSITGVVNGGTGNDSLVLEFIAGSDIAPVSFIGGEGQNEITLEGELRGFDELSGFDGRYVPGVSLGDAEQITYTNNAQSEQFSVSFSQVQNVTNEVNATSMTIEGSSRSDQITLGNNNFTVSSLSFGVVDTTRSTVTFTNGNIFTILAGVNDDVQFGGEINLAGENSTFTIDNAEVSVINPDAMLSANQLILNGVSGLGASDAALNTDIDTLTINQSTGDIYIAETDRLEIDAFTTNGTAGLNIDIAQAGSVTSDANWVSSGNISIRTFSGNIGLTGENQLSGELHLNAQQGDIILDNEISARLGDVIANNLTVTSGGGISDVDGSQILVDDLTRLEASGDIVLDNNGHSFRALQIVDGVNAIINDSDALGLTLNAANITGNLSLSSNGLDIGGDIISDIEASNIALDAGEGIVNINADLLASSASEDDGIITIVGGTVIQNADVVASSQISITSSGEYQVQVTDREEGAYQLSSENAGIHLQVAGDITLGAVTAVSDIVISTTGLMEGGAGELFVNEAITSSEGSVSLTSAATLSLENSVSAINGATLISTEGDIRFAEMPEAEGDGVAVTSELGEVSLDAFGSVLMADGSSIAVTEGTVSVIAGSDIVVTSITAGGAYVDPDTTDSGEPVVGLVTLNSQANAETGALGGGIIDGDQDAVNIVADRLVMDAQNGIGNDEALDIQVNRLSAGNHVPVGTENPTQIDLISSDETIVERLHNNGDIALRVLNGDLILDNSTYSEAFDLDARSEDANSVGGVINANWNIGYVTLEVNDGDLLPSTSASAAQPSLQRPVIVAREGRMNTPQGQSGDFWTGRQLSLLVRDTWTADGRTAHSPIAAFRQRLIFINNAEFKPDLASLINDAGDLLVEIESLDTVNPAVFSAVSNYSQDQISILMPADQRYDYTDDDEESDTYY